MKKMKAFIQTFFSWLFMLISTFSALFLLGTLLLVMAVLLIILEALLPEEKENNNYGFSQKHLSAKESKN